MGETKSKRIKLNVDPVLLVVFGYSTDSICLYVSDHYILDGLNGHYSANKRIDAFYTEEMHRQLLDEIGEDIPQLGADTNDDFSKQSCLYELFHGDLHGGRKPKRGEVFRSTITLYVDPVRFKKMK